MIPAPIHRYLKTRAVNGPWRIAGCPEGGFAGAVVIPALAESGRLFSTLACIATNPPPTLATFLVLVVVNHREDAGVADKQDNRQTLWRLAGCHSQFPLNLAWVDAASPGLELPKKGGGVGLARKIGLDLALTRLNHNSAPALLICLDADTLVQPSYLPALVQHFRHNKAGGATIPFRHQPGKRPDEQQAIDLYELFLRHYVLGLKLAGSPYAFHTVGSAMAATSTSYVRSGGMNTRMAGEDFYFLQHVSRTDGVAQVNGTIVFPSPRASHRVPFGTGRSVSRWLDGDSDAITFYRPECFQILAEWLELVRNGLGNSTEELMMKAERLSPHLAEYLQSINFVTTCGRLQHNHPIPEQFLCAFHGWFDGLKTMKLIHHLSAHGLTRCAPSQALPGLLKMAAAPPAEGVAAQLELLRQLEQSSFIP